MLTPQQKAEAIKKQLIIINELLKKPENKLCADCKKTSPTWASVNLGVFVCINCSGCHREIGVHITKIRSVNLDVWPKETLNHFKIINNKIANSYWECKLKNFDFKKIQNDNYRLVEFIRDKYEHKKWVDPSKKADPMTLIIKGKMKKFKKLYAPHYDEEEEEEEQEEEVEEKKKKGEKDGKKKDSENESEEEKGEEEEEEKEEEEVEKKDTSKKNKNEIISKPPLTERPKKVNNENLLDMDNNNNSSLSNPNLLNLNANNPVDGNNILDLFSNNTNSSDKVTQPQTTNNNYFSPQPMHPTGFGDVFQNIGSNAKLNLQSTNNIGMNNMFNQNRLNSMQNISNFNTNMNNLNFGMNNNITMNININSNNNYNIQNNNSANNAPTSNTKPTFNQNPTFNMDYFNKNMEQKKSTIGSTYNFSKNKADPFANLVSFKK